MTAPDIDPFADDPISRDGYGRPRIIPIKRGKPDLKGKLVPYTRVSTFCDALDDAGGLLKWSKWHLALGLGRNPDLAALAGVFGPTVDDLSRADKQALDAIIERAHDRSGGNAKADYGTAVHGYTEPGAQDVADPFAGLDATGIAELHALIAASIAADAAAYHDTLQRYGLEAVDTEQFVVNDDVQAAGTYDHLVKLTRPLTLASDMTLPAGTVFVLDKKTGKLHFDSQCIQLAVYANSKRYNPETGERAPLGASLDYGMLAHIPKGEARCDLYLIDLRIGWAAAKLAGKVREHRTRKDIAQPFPTVEPSEPVAPALTVVEQLAGEDTSFPDVAEPVAYPVAATVDAPETVEEALAVVVDILGPVTPIPTAFEKIETAETRDELAAIWREHKPEWSDEHTAAFRARVAVIDQAA